MELNLKQVIKALEWCSSSRNCVECTECDKNPFLSKEGCMSVQMRNALAHIKALTEENERLRAEGEWISVTDRLPKPYVSILVYMPDEEPHPTVREGFITKRGEWYAGGFDRLPDEVVAWTEMPRAPKTKGE